jgi:hypothetical protein
MDSAPPERKRLDYRQEARSIRAMASEVKNSNVQEQLLLIASLYDKLADLSAHALPPFKIESTTGRSDAV